MIAIQIKVNSFDAIIVLNKRWRDIFSRVQSSSSQPDSKNSSKVQWDGECHQGTFVVGHSLFDDFELPCLPTTVDLHELNAVLEVKENSAQAGRGLLIALR